jgi:hypothetical protein
LRANPVFALAAALGLAVTAPSEVALAQNPGFDDKITGFLRVATGGMPADAWGSTSLANAKRLMSALPPAPRSRALRDLQFKVMVSELVPPPPDNSPAPSLFMRKVERMAAMGEGESLNELVRSAGAYSDPAIASITANALMLAGELAGGCNIVQNQKLTPAFALRAEAACKLAAGDNAAALALIEGQRGRDNALVTLVQLAAGAVTPTAAPAGPLDGPAMLMLELAHVPPPAAALQSTQPPIMRALVANKTLALPVRIEIAERGEALAIIEATRLGDLYVQAVREGATLPAAMARRAQLVVAARDATNPHEIMNAITAIYAATRNSPLFPTLARAAATALLSLPPKPEYANVAQEAMRGFLLLGDQKLSLAWTKLALNAAYNNARAMMALDRLMPLVMIAGIDKATRIDARDVDRWYEVIQGDDPKAAPMRGYVLLQLFRAVGLDIPPKTTTLPENPPGARLVMPATATLQALQAAAADRRRAEAALLASIAIGETPLAELHPAAVGTIVRALRDAGEDHAARLFAIEIAIAHGL